MTDALLDTTFFIDLRKGDQGAEHLWERVLRRDLTAAFSAMTFFELWVGPQFGPDDEDFYSSMLAILEEAPVTGSSAAQAGVWLRHLERRTRETLMRDALIASCAFERGELVLTRNLGDFARFPVRLGTY